MHSGSEQTKNEEHVEHINAKRLLVTVFFVVLASVITAGSVWFYMNKLNEVSVSTSSNLVKSLEQQVIALKKAVKETSETSVVVGTNPDYGTITGKLTYPSEAIPSAMSVFAVSTADSKTYEASIVNNETTATYSVSVPAGSYYVYGKLGSEKAYYDKFVTCGMTVSCKDTSKISVVVNAGKVTSNITVGDWWNPVQ